jgi:anti-sigma regulatory factor (Ser/Thr protein kinase)
VSEKGYTFQINADAGQAIKVLDDTGKAILTLSNQAGKGGAGLDGLAMNADQLADKLLGAGNTAGTTGKKLGKTGQEASTAAQKLQVMFHSVELLKAAFGGLSSVASGIGSIFGSMRGSIDETAASFRQATLYGIDPKWLSEMTAVAKAAGREMDDVLDVVRDVRERVGEAVREMDAGNMANTFVVAFKELGATEKDIRHWQHSTVEAVEFVMKAMGEAGGASATLQMTLQEIASAGTEKFGPIMAALGEQGLAGALDTVRAMGLSSSVALGKMAEEVSFQMGLIGQVGDGLRTSFMAGLMPVLKEMTDMAIEFIGEFGPKSNEGIQEFARNLSGTILNVVQAAIDSLRDALALINEKGIWNAFTETAKSTWDTFTLYAEAAIYTVAAKMVEVLSTAMASSMSWLSDFLFFDEAGSQQAAAGFAQQGAAAYGQATASGDAPMGQGSFEGVIAGLDTLSGKVTTARENVENYTVATEAATVANSANTQGTIENAEAKGFSAQLIADLEHAHAQESKATETSLVVLRAERDALAEAAAAGMTQAEALQAVELATIHATAAQKVMNGLSQESADAWVSQQLEARELRQEIEKLNVEIGGTSTQTKSLESDFSSAFKGMIDGSQTLAEGFKGIGLSMATQLSDSFFSEMKGFAGGFKNLFSDLGSWVSKMFGNLFDGLGDSIGGWLSSTFGGSGGGGGFFSGIANTVGGWFSGSGASGGGSGGGIMSWLGGIGTGIMDMFSGDGGFLSNLGDWFMGEDGVLSSIGDGISNFASNALGNLASFGTSLLNSVVSGGLSALGNLGLEMIPDMAKQVLGYIQQGASVLGSIPALASGAINFLGGSAMATQTGGVVYNIAGNVGYIGSGTGSLIGGVADAAGGFAFGALGGGLISRAMYPDNPQAQMGGTLAGGVAGAGVAYAAGGLPALGASMGIGAVGSGASTLSGVAAFGGGAAAVVAIGVAIGMMVSSIIDAFRHFKTFDGTMTEVTKKIVKATDAYGGLNDRLAESGLLNKDGNAYKVDPFGGLEQDAFANPEIGQRFSGYGQFMAAATFLANPGLENSTRQTGYNWSNRFGERRHGQENAIVAAEGMADRLAANLANIEAQLIEQGMDVEMAAQAAMTLAKDHLDEWGVTLPGLMALMDPVLFMAQNSQFSRDTGLGIEARRQNSTADVVDSVQFIQDMFGDQMPTGLNARMIYQAGLVPFGAPQKLTDFGSEGNVIGTGQNYGSGGTGGLGALDMDPQQVAELNWLLGSGASMDEINAYFAEKYPGNPLNVGADNFAGTNQPFAAAGPNDFAAAGLYKEVGESDEEFFARAEESIENWEMFDAERAADFVNRWAASAEMVKGNFYKIWGNADTTAGIDDFIDSAFEATLKSQFEKIEGQIVDELFNDTIIAGAMLPVTTLLDEMNDMEIDWLDPEQAAHWTEIMGTSFEEARANMEAMAPAIEEAKERAEQLSYIFMTGTELVNAMIAKHGQEAVDRYFVSLLAAEAVAANGIDAVMAYLAALQAAADEQQSATESFWQGIQDFASAVEAQAMGAVANITNAISDSIINGTYAGVDTLGGVYDNLADNLSASVVNGIVNGFVTAAGLKGDIEAAVTGIAALGADGFTPDELYWIDQMILGPLRAKIEGLDLIIRESGILDLFPETSSPQVPGVTPGTTPGQRPTGTNLGGELSEFERGLGLGVMSFGPSVGLSVMSWENSAQAAARDKREAEEQRREERWQRRIGDLTTTLEETPNHIEVKVDGDTLLTAVTKSDRIAAKGNRAGGF